MKNLLFLALLICSNFIFSQKTKKQENLQNTLYIDVRTEEEFKNGSYKNAINIPLDQIDKRSEEIKKQGKNVVIFCRSGKRAQEAIKILNQKGIQATNGKNKENLEKIQGGK